MNFYPYNKNKIIRSSNENIIIEKPDLKIACILDNFSYQCLKYECDLIQLDIENWIQILLNEKPNLLLVESAWTGIKGCWWGKIHDIDNKKGILLQNIINLCKKLKIPTVFWNKEDPNHFDEFIEAAKLFEYIFTTDKNCIPKYKKILHHNKVYILPFAAQIKIHNPINKNQKKIGNVAFAGSWYISHLDRKRNMNYILEPALKYNLHIYDRNYNYNIIYNNNYHRFPDIYNSFIKGYVPYKNISETYKKYDVFLNVNSVNDSPTMFSRRVFELLACGTNVISSYSLGIEKMFPEIIKLARIKKDTLNHLEMLLKNKELRDRLSLLGQREVFSHHTYTLRIETILEKTGIAYEKHITPGVSIISCITDENNITHLLKNYERQVYENKELIIILNNSNINLEAWQTKVKIYKSIKIFKIDAKKSLSHCLNYAIKNTRLEYVSIFDANDYYAPNYISDIMNAFKYTNADIIGKYSYYAYLESYSLLITMYPNIENRYVESIESNTMVIRKTVFDRLNFPGESSEEMVSFFHNCFKMGISIYATDRFNYVCIKRLSPNDSTYKIGYEDLLRKIKIVRDTKDYINDVTV